MIGWLQQFLPTLLLHSTVAVVAIGLLHWVQRRRGKNGDVEAWWRLALLGPLLTASVSTVSLSTLGWVPTASWQIGPSIRIESELAGEPTTGVAASSLSQRVGEREVTGTGRRTRSGPTDPNRQTKERPSPASPATVAQMGGVLAVTWIAATMIWAAYAMATAARGYRWALQGRCAVQDRATLAVLERLRRSAGIRRHVRLSATRRIRGPVSFGLWTPEICLPERALAEFDARELEAALAHEVGHLRRHDPWWSWIHQCFRGLAPLQPLWLLVLRRLERISEHRCDDWAADATGRPLELAAALTTVASWIGPPPATLETRATACMARAGERLETRIERLLAPRATAACRGNPRRSTALLAIGLALVPALAWGRGDGPSMGVADFPERPRTDRIRSERPAARDATLIARIQRELRLLRREIDSLRTQVEGDGHAPDVAARLETLDRRGRELSRIFAIARTRLANGEGANHEHAAQQVVEEVLRAHGDVREIE